MNKSKILILCDWFVPAFKAGGPIRSCENFALEMQRHFSIYVLTSDTDFGEKEPLKNIISDTWNEFDHNISICYLSKKSRSIPSILYKIKEINPDYIYLNSLFSFPFTIMPLLLKWQKKINYNTILAPRGMLQLGAIRFKPLKKRAFLFIANMIGLFKDVKFHATDPVEKGDLIQHININENQVKVIPNIPFSNGKNFQSIKKDINSINLVYISRISPKKNLHWLLELLQDIPDIYSINFEIYGPTDPAYNQECVQLSSLLPKNCLVSFKGPIPFNLVPEALNKNHFFVLPTLGENFGHAIFESFALGRPVIISDRTPWKSLEDKGIGWDIPLENPDQFLNSIISAAEMGQKEFDFWCNSSYSFAKSYLEESNLVERYKSLFS